MQSRSGPIETRLRQAEDELAKFALSFPETFEDNPWGHRAFKAKKPIFVFLVLDVRGLCVTVKLPDSNVAALDRPFCEPTGYGMAKHGWVTATFEAHDAVPLELLRAWITESFRAVAPKKLVAAFDGVSSAPATVPPRSKKAPRTPPAKTLPDRNKTPAKRAVARPKRK